MSTSKHVFPFFLGLSHLLSLPYCVNNLDSFSSYFAANENLSSGSNELSCNLSSRLLHLAWHPTTNFIACAAGNSLYMYYA